MSVSGFIVSTLQLYGAPGRLYGVYNRRLVIPLTFDLQIAGSGSGQFPSSLQACQNGNAGIQIAAYVVDQLGNPVDISAATNAKLRFQRPDGTAYSIAVLFITNGMDGGLGYITSETDFIQDGTWSVQASFLLSGDKKTTQWGNFTVDANIAAP
jgi:hypothetical protein